MLENHPDSEEFEAEEEELDPEEWGAFRVRYQAMVNLFGEHPTEEDFLSFIDKYNQVFDKLRVIFEDYLFFL
jgi:hypothetical protein